MTEKREDIDNAGVGKGNDRRADDSRRNRGVEEISWLDQRVAKTLKTRAPCNREFL